MGKDLQVGPSKQVDHAQKSPLTGVGSGSHSVQPGVELPSESGPVLGSDPLPEAELGGKSESCETGEPRVSLSETVQPARASQGWLGVTPSNSHTSPNWSPVFPALFPNPDPQSSGVSSDHLSTFQIQSPPTTDPSNCQGPTDFARTLHCSSGWSDTLLCCGPCFQSRTSPVTQPLWGLTWGSPPPSPQPERGQGSQSQVN